MITNIQYENFKNNLFKYKEFYKLKFDELPKKLGMSRAFFSQTMYLNNKPNKSSIKQISNNSKIDIKYWLDNDLHLTNFIFNKLDEKYNPENIGYRIEYLRKKFGLKNISNITDISIYKLNLLEKGKELNINNLLKIAINFNINIDYILGLSLNQNYNYENQNKKIVFNSKRFKELLDNNDLSVYQLSSLLKLNVTTIYSWIKNRTKPKIEYFFDLAKILKCSVNELLNIEDKSTEERKFTEQKLIYELREINDKLDTIINSFIFGELI